MSKTFEKRLEVPAIKIIKVPAGEAPEWVRSAWVGLVLPCDPFVGYAEKPDMGVVTLIETKGRKGRSYAVLQKDAIEILSKSNPDAAKWWLSCGFPKFTPGEDRFGFDADVAVVVYGVVAEQKPGIVYDDMETGRWEPCINVLGLEWIRKYSLTLKKENEMNTSDVVTCVSLEDLIARAEEVVGERKGMWPKVETAIITARQAVNSAEQTEIESAYDGLEKALKVRGDAIIELAAANFDAACE